MGVYHADSHTNRLVEASCESKFLANFQIVARAEWLFDSRTNSSKLVRCELL